MIDTPPVLPQVPARFKPSIANGGASFFTFATGNGNQYITINLATIISIAWYMSEDDAPVLATVQAQDDVYFDVAGGNAAALWTCLAT